MPGRGGAKVRIGSPTPGPVSTRPKAVVHQPKPIALKQSFIAARTQKGFDARPDEGVL